MPSPWGLCSKDSRPSFSLGTESPGALLCCLVFQSSLSVSSSAPVSFYSFSDWGSRRCTICPLSLCSRVPVTLPIFIGHQFCFRLKACVAGLGTAFPFAYVGSGCRAASEGGKWRPVWKGEAWDKSELGFPSAGGGASGGRGEISPARTSHFPSVSPCTLSPFTFPFSFSSSSLLLPQAHRCPSGPKNLQN